MYVGVVDGRGISRINSIECRVPIRRLETLITGLYLLMPTRRVSREMIARRDAIQEKTFFHLMQSSQEKGNRHSLLSDMKRAANNHKKNLISAFVNSTTPSFVCDQKFVEAPAFLGGA